MAGVADKARFYLERAVPQLREFEEKEIFSKDEIRTLVTKRSNFEHVVLAPRSKPDDFISYAQWEQSLEALRAKRCRRLKIHNSSSHTSEGRTFKIYDRAVQRHPGDVRLWTEYLAFASKVRATKRWRKVATQALRMHPRDAGLWKLAGVRAAQNGDMQGAREYFMRGCRFCVSDASLWVAYAKCEMEWLRRIETKKNRQTKSNVTAIEAIRAEETTLQDGDMITFDDSDEDDEDEDGALRLPDPDAGKAKKDKQKLFDAEAAKKLESSPALSGAIPMAIFDISKKQPFFGPVAAEQFFEMFGSFPTVSSQPKILQHVLTTMEEAFPNHPATCSCLVRQPIVGISPQTAAFPKGLRESLARLKSSLETTSDKESLVARTVAWVDVVLAQEDLDEGIRTVLEHTKKRLES